MYAGRQPSDTARGYPIRTLCFAALPLLDLLQLAKTKVKHDDGNNPSSLDAYVKTNFKPLIPIRSNEIPKDDTPKSCIQDDTELDPMDIENPEQ
ncbi:hypothetical protein EJB05_33199, partial [Eragrostis curvula]